MDNQKRNFILLRIIDKIQEDHPDARDMINKSVAKICEEENVYFEQIFYISDAISTNNSTFHWCIF